MRYLHHRRVVVHKHGADGHCGNLGNQDSANRVGNGCVHTDKLKYHLLVRLYSNHSPTNKREIEYSPSRSPPGCPSSAPRHCLFQQPTSSHIAIPDTSLIPVKPTAASGFASFIGDSMERMNEVFECVWLKVNEKTRENEMIVS